MGELANSASMVSASMDFSFRGWDGFAYTARTHDTRPRGRCHPGPPPATAPPVAPESRALRDPARATTGVRLLPRHRAAEAGPGGGPGAGLGHGVVHLLGRVGRPLPPAR